jgi:predicted transcriptional regulator
LRDAVGKTQVDIAQQSQIDQADISRLESRSDFEDCQVATLRRYVEALGGSLEIVAQIGDKRLSIVGIHKSPVARPSDKASQHWLVAPATPEFWRPQLNTATLGQT